MINSIHKKIFLALIILMALFLAFRVLAFFSDQTKAIDFENATKMIVLDDNGFNFKLTTKTNSVSEFLKENKIELGDHDRVIPDQDAKIFTGTHIEIQRAVKIGIAVDGKKIDNYVLGKTVREALIESQVTLSRLDKTTPSPYSLISDNLQITVTRINIEEVTSEEDVDFKTTIKNDATLGWQEKKIETTGQFGKKEVRYRITYKNNKEISRVILETKITQSPTAQVEVHGTYMKLGKAASGQGTWYSYQGGLFAASTAIPKGAYAKVTNTANGKSVIVQINDYGPQGKGRVIDLDKVAFTKISALGAGVIGVRVEPVLN